MARCDFCGRELPEPGYSHYARAIGMLGHEVSACISCVKRLKLKIVRLERAERSHE